MLADNVNAPLSFIKSSDLWEYPLNLPDGRRVPTSYKWSYGAPISWVFNLTYAITSLANGQNFGCGRFGFFPTLQAKYVDDMPKLPGTLHAVGVLGVILGATEQWAVDPGYLRYLRGLYYPVMYQGDN